jgi:hypothetical protein
VGANLAFRPTGFWSRLNVDLPDYFLPILLLLFPAGQPFAASSSPRNLRSSAQSPKSKTRVSFCCQHTPIQLLKLPLALSRQHTMEPDNEQDIVCFVDETSTPAQQLKASQQTVLPAAGAFHRADTIVTVAPGVEQVRGCASRQPGGSVVGQPGSSSTEQPLALCPVGGHPLGFSSAQHSPHQRPQPPPQRRHAHL